ncbi:TauD/TfdA family dioxygenase [Bacillus gobiensis]|uniref:TauD/TfdA dioxygenase family protein n=1 Tax=Bacillus gobiensis TaxID=1441095 RepID=UPI003D2144C3
MSLVEKSNLTDKNLEIHPVAGRIGAEIQGVRLSDDLDTPTIDAIKQALLKYKVIFFRGQNHLDDKSQEAFAQLLGDLVSHPTVPTREETDYIHELDSSHGGGRANSWHTDVSFVDAYPKASILRAVVVPPFGGDTVWANTATAYQDLSPELRDLADRLWALHSNEYDYLGSHTQASSKAIKHFTEVFTSTVIETEHPVVQVHPETGERTLILGHFAKKILGLSSSDSFHLFSVLQNHIISLENTVRWHWEAGDVAIWDNRATQHYAINDYGDQHRVVRRVTVEGEVPISVDGRRSVTRRGK